MLSYRLKVSSPYSPENVLIPTKSENLKEPPPIENQDFGFELDRRIVANINPRLAGYRTGQLPILYRRIRDSLTNIPSVSSVALCLYSPPGGGWASGVWVDGHPAPGPREDNSSSWDRVTPGYFDVIG